MIKVIDNFLTKSYHKELLGIMTSAHFSWYFNQNISKKQKNVISRLNEYGFTHIFWDENGMRDTKTSILWKPGLYQIMDAVNLNFILRSRGDMTMYSHKEFVHDPHVDYYFKNISAVYYVNNSDGDTIFYNQRQFNKNEPMPKKLEITNKVSPKANRLVFFDGNIIHTGMSPNKHKNRIIINSNFKL
jgi:hypothetical protein|tara:strand:+ start:91 stop:651 length:561 start_codon:yes stop_codon:yes gene_type:complete